jgi:flagellar biosynthesis chaperone FliJ
MKRFVWRLQRVLDIKTKEEQTKKTELLKITERLAQARGKLLMQKRVLENIISDITGKHPHKRLPEQEFFLKCSVTNDRLIKILAKNVIELESRQMKKILELLSVKRFKEGLEKLRAEAKRRFINHQEKLEQKDLDETATVGFARKLMHLDKIGTGKM